MTVSSLPHACVQLNVVRSARAILAIPTTARDYCSIITVPMRSLRDIWSVSEREREVVAILSSAFAINIFKSPRFVDCVLGELSGILHYWMDIYFVYFVYVHGKREQEKSLRTKIPPETETSGCTDKYQTRTRQKHTQDTQQRQIHVEETHKTHTKRKQTHTHTYTKRKTKQKTEKKLERARNADSCLHFFDDRFLLQAEHRDGRHVHICQSDEDIGVC